MLAGRRGDRTIHTHGRRGNCQYEQAARRVKLRLAGLGVERAKEQIGSAQLLRLDALSQHLTPRPNGLRMFSSFLVRGAAGPGLRR
jgi:hypothetical protein